MDFVYGAKRYKSIAKVMVEKGIKLQNSSKNYKIVLKTEKASTLSLKLYQYLS